MKQSRRLFPAVLALLGASPALAQAPAAPEIGAPKAPAVAAAPSAVECASRVPLAEPNMSTARAGAWFALAAADVYSFSFADYRKELTAASADFTPEGWQGFQEALKQSGNLQTVLDQKLVVGAVPTGVPFAVSQGVVGGRWTWTFEMPLLVVYQSATGLTRQNLALTGVLTRQPECLNPDGLGIKTLVAG